MGWVEYAVIGAGLGLLAISVGMVIQQRQSEIAAARVMDAFIQGWYSARRHPGIAAATHSPDFPAPRDRTGR